MDETVLNELLECSVCLDRLGSTSKVLPCQHTFCKRCLEEILASKKQLICPECRTHVTIPINDLPPNILLQRLLEGMKSIKLSPNPNHQEKKHKQTITKKAATVVALTQTKSPCARALYNYDAKENGDLSFKKGDQISLKRQIDDNWYHGELNGKSGFFPITYVQVIQPLTPQEPPQAKALYRFDTQDDNEDCITFEKDSNIQVIRRVDNNWAEGKLGDRIGIFPLCFVQLNEAARWLMEYHEVVQNLNTSPTNRLQSTSIKSTNKRHSVNFHQSSSASPKLSQSSIYIALYSYKPANNDELELSKGHFYGVIEHCQDGWCRGFCVRTNKYGVFPGNYILPTARQRSSKRSQSSPAKNRNFPKTNAVSSSNENSPRNIVAQTRTITNVTQAQNRALLAATISTTANSCNQQLTASSCSNVSNGLIVNVNTEPISSPATSNSKNKDKDRLNVLAKRISKKRNKNEEPVLGPLIPIPLPPQTSNTNVPQNIIDLPVQPAKPKALRERYRCLTPYPAQSGYEVDLKVGDILYVHRKQKDGWFKGTLQRTGKSGLFPASFVEKF